MNLPDIQKSKNKKLVPINKVGIYQVKYPINISNKYGYNTYTVGKWSLYIYLSEKNKGTHMSRFIILIEKYYKHSMNYKHLKYISIKMIHLLISKKGEIKISFLYFIKKISPVSKITSIMDYEIHWISKVSLYEIKFILILNIPVHSLCPCSKFISKYGAHNQRSLIKLSLVLEKFVNIEKIINFIEKKSSCELWSFLKRQDEKYVTEYAYKHPKFVEDLLRDMSKCVSSISGVSSYHLESKNFESIHNHNVYAKISCNAIFFNKL